MRGHNVMTLPTWNELQLQISEFENSTTNIINEHIHDIERYDPIVHRAIKTSINTILPFPTPAILHLGPCRRPLLSQVQTPKFIGFRTSKTGIIVGTLRQHRVGGS